ncbi:hypothetical protein [Candidatus Frankia nodulisporulans]|uniref:hypothetical protein n=1 Tax=Candidatus Frankia nodulisporulans TaxID=2060052 RepID=UPI0013D3510D|nr:hypothetical protein [Candidatus Frankia nodulisporulans]
MPARTEEYPRTWVLDAANVIGAGADGWWRDRPGAARRLLAAISAWIDSPPDGSGSPRLLPTRIVVVLEGAARAGHPAGPVTRSTGPDDASTGSDVTGSADVTGGAVGAGGKSPTVPVARPILEVVHASGHGDDAIVAAAREAGPEVLVTTSDRALAERVRAFGARTHGARWLRDTIGL